MLFAAVHEAACGTKRRIFAAHRSSSRLARRRAGIASCCGRAASARSDHRPSDTDCDIPAFDVAGVPKTLPNSPDLSIIDLGA
jgi:hypothetical protein